MSSAADSKQQRRLLTLSAWRYNIAVQASSYLISFVRTVDTMPPVVNKNKHGGSKQCAPAKKKRKVLQSYRPDYASEYPVITKSTLDCHHAYCKVCCDDINISHGGICDVKQHVNTVKHKSKAIHGNVKKLPAFFASSSDNAVINAEVKFTEFLVEHSIPLAASDHAGALFRQMFPDSAIAKKYGSARTKTSCIVETLAKCDSRSICEAMKSAPYSIATDGSNDYDSIKLYPLVVRYFAEDIGKVVCVLLTMTECTESSTGENIFKLLDTELTKMSIPWSNCMSLAADNASVMMGKVKGVAAFLSKKAPSAYLLGCACHLVHLAAGKAADCLLVKVDELLIDIYYYLEKSSKRHQQLKAFQQICNTENHKILKHVSVRWLSIGVCLDRLLEQWPALDEMFKAEFATNKSSGAKSSKHTSSSKENKTSTTTTSSSKVKHKSSITSAPNSRVNNKVSSPSCSTSNQSANGERSNVPNDKSKSMSSERNKSSTSGSSKLPQRSPAQSAGDQPDKQFDLTRFLFKEKQIASKAIEHKAQATENEKALKKAYVSDKSDTRVCRVHKLLQDPFTKLNCLFLHAVIPMFDTVNTMLQKDEPSIHLLHDVLVRLLRNVVMKFVKPSVITAASGVITVNYKDVNNHKEDEDIFIGSEAKKFIEENKASMQTRMPQFYASVKKYYVSACDYMTAKFPLNDAVLINAEVVNIANRQQHTFKQLKYFTDRFPCLLTQEADFVDKLETEFDAYQITILPDNCLKAKRIDESWHVLGQLKDPSTAQTEFGRLVRVVKGILVIFHSNADCERIFSLVNKNKTEFRPNLSTKTLGSLITRKVMMSARSQTCHTVQHSNDVLRLAKSATYTHHHSMSTNAADDGDGQGPSSTNLG